MKLSKRIRMSISVFLTLLAGCAWENSWFGQRQGSHPFHPSAFIVGATLTMTAARSRAPMSSQMAGPARGRVSRCGLWA